MEEVEKIRGFSNEEKERIKLLLLEKGKIEFEEKGFKNIKVSDLSKSVGIATGSFYAFYESKEELFYEIILYEFKKFEPMFINLFSQKENPQKTIRAFMIYCVKGFHETKFNTIAYDSEVYEILSKKIDIEKLDFAYMFAINLLKKHLLNWQEEGLLPKILDLDVTTKLMTTVLFDVSSHSNMEYTEEFHNKIVTTVIDYFVEGIFREGTK